MTYKTKPVKNTTVNLVLLLMALIALLLAALSANGREIVVVPIPKRANLPTPTPTPFYNVCSPYTGYGELCVWHGGIEIPLLSTGPSQFRTMVTLIMPPTNIDWELYRSDFTFTLDYVYQTDCVNNIVTYKNEATLYKNDSVCK